MSVSFVEQLERSLNQDETTANSLDTITVLNRKTNQEQKVFYSELMAGRGDNAVATLAQVLQMAEIEVKEGQDYHVDRGEEGHQKIDSIENYVVAPGDFIMVSERQYGALV